MEKFKVLSRLEEEWCSELNKTPLPANINLKNNKNSHYWRCSHNHIVKTSIKTRALNTCRICKKLENSTNLEESIKNIHEYYNYTLNFPLLPKNINISSHEHIYITCPDCELTKLMEVRKFKNCKNNLYSCAYCSGRIFHKNVNSLEKTFPEYLEYFDYKKNNSTPMGINVKSKMRIYWKCKNYENHSFKLTITDYNKNPNCRICEDLKLLEVEDNFKEVWPWVTDYWNYEKNIGIPEGYKSKSNYLAKFTCPKCHNSFNNYIFKQVKTKNCPYCENRKILKGFNDLSLRFPELKEYWDNEKNVLSIYEVRVTDEVWLKCKKEHSYSRRIFDIKNNISKSCSKCYTYGVSIMEKELLEYVKEIYEGETISNDRNILNGKELDIYLPKLKIAFEFNGYFWHSDEWLLKTKGILSKEWHELKRSLAKDAEVNLFYIWEKDWLENRKLIEEVIFKLIYGNTSNSILEKLE